MKRIPAIGFSRNRLVRRGLAASVLTLMVAMIVSLVLEVRHQLTMLDDAASENVQWTLGQAETEIMALQLAIARAHASTHEDAPRTLPTQGNALTRMPTAAALDAVRLRFDIAYSRIETLTSAQVLTELRELPDVPDQLGMAVTFRDDWVPIIDGPDPELADSLPRLYDESEEVRKALRQVSLDGVRLFARLGDVRRMEISRILSSIGMMTVALVGILLILMIAVLRLARQRERDLRRTRETRERMETMLSTALDAVVAVDSSDRIVEWNGAAERVFGFTRDEALGTDMADLIVPTHFRRMHRRAMREYIRTGEGRVVGRGIIQLEAVRKDGTVFPVDLSLAEAQSPNGEIFVAFVRDISDRVRSELALKRARDRAVAGEKQKAELLAVMSHEMRTPLNGILGTIELFRPEGLDAENRRFLRIIRQSGEMLLAHVNDVLDISRLDAGKMTLRPTRFDLVALLEELVESQSERARAVGNRLLLAPPSPELHNVYSDPDRLRQILLNLLSNAIKFTRDGRITIEADVSEGLHSVELRVIDTGTGIAPEDMERIFDDFVTIDPSYGRRNTGTGLGLGISQRLASALGGELGAESEPGDGSLFWLRLPLNPPTGITAEAPRSRARSDSASTRLPTLPPLDVLIIEDNAINREVARRMLQRDDHKVTEACDGQAGVDAAMAQDFDVILMDISMPGLDGIAAARAIRAGGGRNAHTPIIATTAHALPDEVQAFHAAGMNAVLTKPITIASLGRALATALSLGAEALSRGDDGPTPAVDTAQPSLPFPQTPPPAATSPAAIDVEHFAELQEDLEPERLRDVLRDFAAEIDSFLAALPASLASPEASLSDLSAEAHRLAGSAGVFGAMTLAGQLRQAQVDARTGDRAALKRLETEMQATWAASCADLAALGFPLG